MKCPMMFFLCAVAFSASALDLPEVFDVSLGHKIPASQTLVVDYRLTNGPAIVTATFFTNNVPLPDNVVTSLSGDVCRIVTNASCRFIWDATKDWPGHQEILPLTKVTIAARPLYFPPRYCRIDLSGGTNATSYPLYFYESSNAVPGGVESDRYKTTDLLLRKIDRTGSGGFLMGSPLWEANRNANREHQHTVILTQDYYMGVYEVTVGQWQRVMGTSVQPNHTGDERYPMEKVTYGEWRGARSENIDFPTTGLRVSTSSFMGALRQKTGNIYPFDLPTEAQWEYAARAGIVDSFADGSTMSWRSATQQTGKIHFGTNATSSVGSYMPTRWGLYDVQGNVVEWCRDWLLDANLPDATDPVGPYERQTYRSARGGHYDHAIHDLRFAQRNAWNDTSRYNTFGARLSATIIPIPDASLVR